MLVVGRFAANLRLVGEEILPDMSQSNILDDPALKNLNYSDIVRPLPASNYHDFTYRIRVDCRSAMNLMMNRVTPKGLPSCFLEVGLAEKDNKRPDDQVLEVTKTIRDDRNPIWNTQFLLKWRDDQEEKEKKFIYVGLVDKADPANPEILDQIWLPIEPMTPFLPYHYVSFYSLSFVSLPKK